MASPAPPSSRSRSRPTSHQPPANGTAPNHAGASYAQGYQASVLAAHAQRTAGSSAAYLLPHLTTLSARQPRLRILDVGCGPGSITVDLAARFPLAEVIGLEPADGAAALEAARELARERGVTNVRFVVGNVHSLVSSLDDPAPSAAAAAAGAASSKHKTQRATAAAAAASTKVAAKADSGDAEAVHDGTSGTAAADATGDEHGASADAAPKEATDGAANASEEEAEAEADAGADAVSEDAEAKDEAADSTAGGDAATSKAADGAATTAAATTTAAPAPAPARFAPGSFDVVHAHEVLQHCGDPVGALRQMRRVCRWGGCVAVRTADMGTIEYAPTEMPPPAALAAEHREGAHGNEDDEDDEDTKTPTAAAAAATAAPTASKNAKHATLAAFHPVKAWQRLFMAVIFASGGEPRAGRMQSTWARDAGLDSAKMVRSWGAQSWDASPAQFHAAIARHADRLVNSGFALTAIRHGLATEAKLAQIADGFRVWGALDGARISILEGEMVCFV